MKFELRYFVLTKKLTSFLHTRGRYVASIWASVLFLLWLLFQTPWLSGSDTKALLVTKTVSLADSLLVGTLLAGTLVIVSDRSTMTSPPTAMIDRKSTSIVGKVPNRRRIN